MSDHLKVQPTSVCFYWGHTVPNARLNLSYIILTVARYGKFGG